MPENIPMILRWSAYEHEHIERGSDWFWALGIVAVCVAITSILFGNILFAILIIVAAITIAIVARTPPELVQFEISDRGVRVGGRLHRWDEIISFWVEDEHGGEPFLLVDTIKFMSPNLIIPLQDIDPDLVRAYLSERVNEVPMKEPISHKILEFFGI
ncbi:MAG: hypothetical protein UY63_C0017G0070 [Parcubacteria group bacterium GW2011_GWA2_51_10]|nr:MAG: hypothetical protein UY63_C0017G0070 [Parcubacteria group bacterium GW2011_GWA2_51_10]